jgi:hypothetical protein
MKELVKGLTEKRNPGGTCVLRVHYSADPDRAKPEWKERESRKYTSEGAWQREQEVVFSAGGGERLFAEILHTYGHKIIIDPESSGFEPSPHWNYFGGFDSGKANPTAALVACTDFDGTVYILREYYVPGLSPKEHIPGSSSCGVLSARRCSRTPRSSTRRKRRTMGNSRLSLRSTQNKESTTSAGRRKTTNCSAWSASVKRHDRPIDE